MKERYSVKLSPCRKIKFITPHCRQLPAKSQPKFTSANSPLQNLATHLQSRKNHPQKNIHKGYCEIQIFVVLLQPL